MPETPPAPRPIAWLRNKFLAGLALVIPLLVTYWILRFIYDFLHDQSTPLLTALAGIYNQTVSEKFQIDTEGPGFARFTSFVGFLLPILVVLGLGVLGTNVIGARLVAGMDQLLLRIPILSFIYKSLKQVIDAFKGLGGAKGFKRVVYVDYPAPGMRMIGFATGHYFDKLTNKAVTCVFLPTAPSPMTGFVIVVDSEKVTDAPLTMEEAMKLIFSGGLVGPEHTTATTSAPQPPVPASTKKKPAAPQPQPAEFVGLPTADDQPELFHGEEPGPKPETETFPSIAENKLEPVGTAAGTESEKSAARSWMRLWKK
jgi:uncharacterized membrane protein